jgi:hypothetical protein
MITMSATLLAIQLLCVRAFETEKCYFFAVLPALFTASVCGFNFSDSLFELFKKVHGTAFVGIESEKECMFSSHLI